MGYIYIFWIYIYICDFKISYIKINLQYMIDDQFLGGSFFPAKKWGTSNNERTIVLIFLFSDRLKPLEIIFTYPSIKTMCYK